MYIQILKDRKMTKLEKISYAVDVHDRVYMEKLYNEYLIMAENGLSTKKKFSEIKRAVKSLLPVGLMVKDVSTCVIYKVKNNNVSENMFIELCDSDGNSYYVDFYKLEVLEMIRQGGDDIFNKFEKDLGDLVKLGREDDKESFLLFSQKREEVVKSYLSLLMFLRQANKIWYYE